MTQPTIAQLYNLTDRAGHGLTADEQQRLRDGIDQMHARLEAAERQPPPTTGTQPTPTHTHIWDGSRHLPDWLTGHHWTAGQLVIRTPDGDTRPQAGWWLIGWTDGSVTAATPTVAERVYGADGIAGQLERAEEEISRLTAAEAADIAAGSYAGRAEEAEQQRDQLAALVRDFLDDDRCDLDAYGYCVAHSWACSGARCPHARARDVLAALDGEQPGPG